MQTHSHQTFKIIATLGACLTAACGRLERQGSPELPAGRAEMLVLGDSLSTGAVTHPDFQLDYDDIVVASSS